MDPDFNTYKINDIPNNISAIRMSERESISTNDDKKSKSDIINQIIPKIFIKDNYEIVFNALCQIASYSNTNLFRDIHYEDIKQIFDFALGINDINDEEQTEINFHDISKISKRILPQLLQQPEIAAIFIEKGDLYEISDPEFCFSEEWAISCLTSIANISTTNRDKIYEFEFYSNFLEKISLSIIPIIDFEVACKFANSLIKSKMSYFQQNQSAREIFPILYDLETRCINSQPEKGVDFIIAAKNLIHHIEWAQEYTKENEIHNIFPFLPNGKSLNNDKPIFPLIEQNINVKSHNDKIDRWFEKSTDYIYDWLFYTFFLFQDQSDDQSYNFDPLWKILFLILSSHFKEACIKSSSCLTLLIHIDLDNFINNQYYSEIVEGFPSCCLEIKLNLLRVISIAFYKATTEQMYQLLQQPHIFDLIFDTLSSVEYHEKCISDLVLGLHRFVDICAYSEEGMIAFQNLVLTNTDFANWVEQLIIYTKTLDDSPESRDLIEKVFNLNNLIHQRIEEYEISKQQTQET